jgi:hypothetical protein
MPLFFFGQRKKGQENSEANVRLTERTKELLSSYNRLTDSVLIDTVRICEGLLDRTGMSDIDRTLWNADFPKEDVDSLAADEENLKAVLRTTKRLYHKIVSLDEKITALNYQMKDLLKNRGTSFTQYGEMEIGVFRKAVKRSEEMRQLLLIRILDDDGKLTKEAGDKAESLISASAAK